MTTPIENPAIVVGLLMVILALVFWSSGDRRFKKFYSIVPAILLCYFIPSIFGSAGLVHKDTMADIYYVASRFLLPASLVLLTLSTDLKSVLALGRKPLIMFLTGTAGILFGGPLAMLIVGTVAPEVVGGTGPEAVWRGLATVAGSWIGGGANQTAMKEIFEAGDSVFSAMITVDVIVANIWMACLLYAAGRAEHFDKKLGADASAVYALRDKIIAYEAQHRKIPTTTDTMVICGVGFGIVGLSHLFADMISFQMQRLVTENGIQWIQQMSLTSHFFWLVVFATTGGLALSFTRLRALEGVGASRIGTILLYVLIASIGLKMNLLALRDAPGLFVVGLIWIAIHAILLIVVAKLIKAPIFFLAVGSQANVGGAASAPVVASAFHPSLAPVGVLLAVVGYTLGTYAAYFCGLMLKAVGS